MPIRADRRWFHSIDWPLISKRVRFETEGPHGKGRCWACGKPHGHEIRVLPDGRWFDPLLHTWRDDEGREAGWPDVVEACTIRRTRIILAVGHKDHDPSNVAPRNLAALCQRHRLLHDRERHRHQFRVTILLRRALGDLFDGVYRRP